MDDKKSALGGASVRNHSNKDRNFSENHKFNNANIARTLDAVAKSCQRSEIGFLFERTDLHSNDLPDMLLSLRRMLNRKISRLEKLGADAPGALKEEIRVLADTVESLDQAKIDVWAAILDYIGQLPKGLEMVVISLPISAEPGGGVGLIDMWSKGGYSYAAVRN